MDSLNNASRGAVIPKEKWEFDADVAECFDDMLARSIPQFDVMRKACFDIGCTFRKPNTDIVDLGCSRGGALEPFVKKYGATNRFVGVEISEPMRNAAEVKFSGLIESGIVKILPLDLREEYPHVISSVTLCVLTLQFTPIEYRLQIVDRIYQSLTDGGALILVEKIIGSTAKLDRMMIDLYYAGKDDQGYDEEAINRKRLSLEGVLVPITGHWNEETLKSAGFRQVDCFWRWMNFAGWVAVKS